MKYSHITDAFVLTLRACVTSIGFAQVVTGPIERSATNALLRFEEDAAAIPAVSPVGNNGLRRMLSDTTRAGAVKVDSVLNGLSAYALNSGNTLVRTAA